MLQLYRMTKDASQYPIMADDLPFATDTVLKYQQRKFAIRIAFWAAILVLVTVATLRPPHGNAVVGFIIALVLVRGLLDPIWLPIKCPSCKQNAASKINKFCPYCGSTDIEAPNFITGRRKCRSCGSNLYRGKRGRAYLIRFCTNCGAKVDSKGV